MTDVRLTATNPEDSSVVPVACNAKGELKLEEPIDNSFDGSLDGDLTVAGSANVSLLNCDGSASFAGGEFTVSSSGFADCRDAIYGGTKATPTNGGFSQYIGVAGFARANTASNQSAVLGQNFLDGGRVWCGVNSAGTVSSEIFETGSAAFAGGKAGFTPEGNLWCTTVRGDTVILDATSGGMGSWQPYTPPSRRDSIKEKVEEWSEKNKKDPGFGVSPQDNTET